MKKKILKIKSSIKEVAEHLEVAATSVSSYKNNLVGKRKLALMLLGIKFIKIQEDKEFENFEVSKIEATKKELAFFLDVNISTVYTYANNLVGKRKLDLMLLGIKFMKLQKEIRTN